MLECSQVRTPADFWSYYLECLEVREPSLFGRNLDAFWQALSNDGAGAPVSPVSWRCETMSASLWRHRHPATSKPTSCSQSNPPLKTHEVVEDAPLTAAKGRFGDRAWQGIPGQCSVYLEPRGAPFLALNKGGWVKAQLARASAMMRINTQRVRTSPRS